MNQPTNISLQEHDDLLKKIRRALQVLSSCSQFMMRIEDELDLLQSICAHITDGAYRMAWVGYAWRDKLKRIEPVAQSGHLDNYLDDLITWADGPAGNNPAGHAIRNRSVSICRDIAADPDNLVWRDAAVQRGYASVIALPLMIADETIGALLIYAEETDSFDFEEVSLLRCLAENLSHAIQAIRIRREHDQALKLIMESKERFQSLYDTSPLLLMTVDDEAMVLSVNRYGAGLLGYTTTELTSSSLLDQVHGKNRDKQMDLIRKCLKHPGQAQQTEIKLISKDGEMLFVKQTANLVVNSSGISDVLIACLDVTEEQKLSRQLNFQAAHDALTGLVNRYEFERRLQRLLASSDEDDTHALCYLDLDQFKLINDTCGHIAGDELLRQLSSMLGGKVRKLDTIARLGGDEFGVLMESCTLEHAHRVANDIRELIQDYRFLWGEHRFSLGASIGLVPLGRDTGTVSDVMSAADAACYAAKDGGRNRIHIYHHDDEQVLKRQGELQWINRINQALDQDRLRLYCQPIVELGKDYASKEEHYEILVRMEADDGQIITPGMFLPAAEKYHLAGKIDQWVIRNTLQWLTQDAKRYASIQLLSINLSGQSISQPEFMNFLMNELQNELLDPEKICFEITETAAISDLANAIRFMYEVKGIGCSFALDDFGSGLSSLNYLKNLPVDYLKIDGAFVRDIVHDRIDFTLVKSISEIGQVMGKLTIAEFVENQDTLNSLTRIGINFGQGYHIGKPAPLRI